MLKWYIKTCLIGNCFVKVIIINIHLFYISVYESNKHKSCINYNFTCTTWTYAHVCYVKLFIVWRIKLTNVYRSITFKYFMQTLLLIMRVLVFLSVTEQINHTKLCLLLLLLLPYSSSLLSDFSFLQVISKKKIQLSFYCLQTWKVVAFFFRSAHVVYSGRKYIIIMIVKKF